MKYHIVPIIFFQKVFDWKYFLVSGKFCRPIFITLQTICKVSDNKRFIQWNKTIQIMTWIRYCLYYLFSNKKHFRVIQSNWLNIIFIQKLFIWLIFDVLFPLHLSIHTKHILSITVWLSTQEITLNFDWFSSTKFYRINSIQ